ncbi:Radical SAM domain heme biosynthesis protein [Thermogutta terrifontis]|uniref:Radical SAM domain heme biosynthesis protein n=2 Tax=Thermogutta terrifontis TaxID=1331910 RepID=A0A286RLI4_9BACT|nr:Radical SAM domain heme biosynthesis protein [Thermogutta terrifontis]
MMLMPTSVQLELTYACNRRCWFCYNRFAGDPACDRYKTAPVGLVRRILDELARASIISINFNGGEPLLHEDFFGICEYAAALGFDLHLNTNASLVNHRRANQIAKFFNSICTTVLSPPGGPHDAMVGQKGAIIEVERGIGNLVDAGVYVAANVVLFKANFHYLYDTMWYLRSLGVETLLVTIGLVPGRKEDRHTLGPCEIYQALRLVRDFQNGSQRFSRFALPQPIPLCVVPDDIRNFIAEANIACTIGLNVARITPSGLVTPCTLVSQPVLGDLSVQSFAETWRTFASRRFWLHTLPLPECQSCGNLAKCGGGCYAARQTYAKHLKNRRKR